MMDDDDVLLLIVFYYYYNITDYVMHCMGIKLSPSAGDINLRVKQWRGNNNSGRDGALYK